MAQPGTARDWKIFPVISFPHGYKKMNTADVAQPGTARDWKIFPVISFPYGYPGSNPGISVWACGLTWLKHPALNFIERNRRIEGSNYLYDTKVPSGPFYFLFCFIFLFSLIKFIN
tara:strand:+ start:427 stop:774 length:348 start_codon:yes stop_codon:yes gene_type:complete